MSANDDAQNAEIDANRKLLGAVVAMQATQNQSLVTVVNSLILGFGELKKELDSRNREMAAVLEKLADDLSAKSENMLRQSAAKSLQDAVSDIRKSAEKLKTKDIQ